MNILTLVSASEISDYDKHKQGLLYMKCRAEELRDALLHDSRPVAVDIICTVYNHGKYLRNALDGMLMQETNFPFRIIVHDDASTDNSADIIHEYQANYPEKIIAVVEKENLYQNGKSILLKMLPYYTSKYLASCEGDDYWTDKNKLQMQIDYLETHPDCIACYHNVLPVNEDGKYDESLRLCYSSLEEGDYTKKEIEGFVLKTQTASLVRRNYLSLMSDMDINFYQSIKCNGDEKNLLVCGAVGRVHYLSEVMAAHRRVFQGDSYTARQAKKHEIDHFVDGLQRNREKCKLYEYLTNRNLFSYNKVLHSKLLFVITHRKEMNGKDYRKLHSVIPIPFYVFFGFIFYCWAKVLRKTWFRISRKTCSS